jgi:hypothetical protein
VFQGEQKRMRRLLILPLTKKQLTKAKPEVDRDAVQAESKAKLVTMLSA